MEHITDGQVDRSRPTAITLGNFDGLHLGHRALIQLTKEFAAEENLESVVFSFSPHPMLVFKKKEDFALIMAPSEKLFTMEQMGVDTRVGEIIPLSYCGSVPETYPDKTSHTSRRKTGWGN